MERVIVRSSVIHSIGYDATTSTLEIEFHNGAVYEYRNVCEQTYRDLMSTDSKGSYFDRWIKHAGYDWRITFRRANHTQ